MSLVDYDKSSGGSFLSASLNGGQYSVSKSLPGGGGGLFATQVVANGTIFAESDVVNEVRPTATLNSSDATNRLQDYGVFTDFVGNGNVSGLTWGYFIFSNSPDNIVRLDDGSPSGLEVEAFVGVEQSVGPTTVYIDYSYQVAAIPEPATVAMMFAGLALLGAVATRRRQR